MGNRTDYSHSQNRRVEIAIDANNQMKADAKTEAEHNLIRTNKDES